MTAGPPPFALRDYALLADGERGIMIGPHGEMAWMCFPSWDSPSAFSALLGGPGHYQVTPREERFVWGGYYEPSSLIWNSRWVTSDAVIECREALAFPGNPNKAVILRRVEAIHGPARVVIRLEMAADYGRQPMTDVARAGSAWTARSGPIHLRWQAGPGVRRARTGALELRLDLAEGEVRDFVLELATHPVDNGPPDPDELWVATREAWRDAIPMMKGFPAERDASHAYAVMRGLTTSTGATVAAATMSLPERAEAGRNYDYRYAWIRDQCFVGQSAAVIPGGDLLLDGSVRFVAERLLDDGPHLKPAYRTTGTPVPDERPLSHLPGYPGGEVKAGNQANNQFQLDALGESLLLFSAAAQADRLDPDAWKAAEMAIEVIEARWRQPEAGIWELEDRWWTHSRLTCVAGLRRIARHRGGSPQAGRWTALADAIAAETAHLCLHPSGRWQRAADDTRVDAALLFPVLRGAVASNDPRTTTTISAIEHELCQDGYVYRFRHDERPLQDAEGAFSLCGLALALAYQQQGESSRAVAWFERNRASCGPPGLLTEEFDVGERQLRGNIPQVFVHALLLECAAHLADG